MSFVITDHLDELDDFNKHSTWAEARCPICNGKLKINLSGKAGAYACYTNGCHSYKGKNLIREYFYRLTPFRRSSIFKKQYYRQELPVLVKELKNIEKDLSKYKSNLTYKSPLTVNTSRGVKTIYKYGDFQVCRVDSIDSKFIYTEYFDNEQQCFIKGVPTSLEKLPLYGLDYLQPCIFMVEGEKCADAMHRVGFAAMSPHASFFTSNRLISIFSYLKTYGVISVIYLEDNDIVGKKKGEWITGAAWSRGINCISFNTAEIFHVETMEYDIADAIADRFNIETRIQEHIDNNANFNRSTRE